MSTWSWMEIMLNGRFTWLRSFQKVIKLCQLLNIIYGLNIDDFSTGLLPTLRAGMKTSLALGWQRCAELLTTKKITLNFKKNLILYLLVITCVNVGESSVVSKVVLPTTCGEKSFNRNLMVLEKLVDKIYPTKHKTFPIH